MLGYDEPKSLGRARVPFLVSWAAPVPPVWTGNRVDKRYVELCHLELACFRLSSEWNAKLSTASMATKLTIIPSITHLPKRRFIDTR